MQPHRRYLAALAVLAAAGSGLSLTTFGSVAAAAGSLCSDGSAYSGTVITWTGNGDGHSWDQATNWSPSTVPDHGQTPATYQTQYVCIGDGKGGKPADVSIAGSDSFHIAGVEVASGASLTIEPGGRLFLGAAKNDPTVASLVDKHSTLEIDASTLGGNSPLTVHGTLKWTGAIVKSHRLVATQTSSECVFDPSIKACPGDTQPGGGVTIISASGKMLVNGSAFGATALTDSRNIDNFGTISFTGFGYIGMGNGSEIVAQLHSTMNFDGTGGIYRQSSSGKNPPRLLEEGNLVRDGGGSNTVVVGVPVDFSSPAPSIKVLGGAIVLDRASAPKSPVHRSGGYGVGGCALVKVALCKQPVATKDAPQVALLGTSKEVGSPKVSTVGVKLVSAPAKLHGHPTLGQMIEITAPTAHTTHSSHLTFMYDATTAGLKSHVKPIVYRGTHAITLCRVHGLTAKNTSCISSEKVMHGGAATRGDLEIVLITIQPDAHWVVAH